MKSKPVLFFDEYGNLTTEPSPDVTMNDNSFSNTSNLEYVDLVNPAMILPSVNKSQDKKDRTLKNCIANNRIKESKIKKVKNDSIELNLVTDSDLKVAFKEEFSSAATSRYGRMRKRKTEDGFIFGTINFNVLKKVISTSPKKIKLDIKLEHHEINAPKVQLNSDLDSPNEEIVNASRKALVEESSGALDISSAKTIESVPLAEKNNDSIKVSSDSFKDEDALSSEKENYDHSQKLVVAVPNKDDVEKPNIHENCIPEKPNRLRRLSLRKKLQACDPLPESNNSNEELKLAAIVINSDVAHNNKVDIENKCTSEVSMNELYKNPSNVTKKVEDSLTNLEIKLTCKGKTTAFKENGDIESKEKSRYETKIDIPSEIKNIDIKPTKKKSYEYVKGDLVWAFIRGSPLWPAIIYPNREEERYTKILSGQMMYVRLYNVLFIEDNQKTQWIHNSSIFPFEGYDKLHSYLVGQKALLKTLKLTQRYKVEYLLKTLPLFENKKNTNKYARWLSAVNKASSCLKLDRQARIKKLVEVENKKTIKQLKNSAKSAKDIEKLLVEKKETSNYDFMNKDVVVEDKGNCRIDLKHKSIPENKKSNLKNDKINKKEFIEDKCIINEDSVNKNIKGFGSGSFLVFLQFEMESFLKNNPGMSKNKAKGKLCSIWKKMNHEEKINYIAKADKIREDNYKRKLEDSVDSNNKRRRLNDEHSEKGTYKIVKNERVCFICEEVSEPGMTLMRCKGNCYGFYHMPCITKEEVAEDLFKCNECRTGKHICFICKSLEGSIVKCSMHQCGKYYHIDCAKNWPQTSKLQNEKLICPRHVCHMCAANADDMHCPVARTGPFTRCLRCPTTYHTGSSCLAAGSSEISGQHHICTKHLDLSKNSHVNISWCFCCSKGGSLLLCDQCPAAFHADCIKVTAPEGGFVCEDCETGKFPVYGDIVWVKVGSFRWWPAEVLHPRYIPDNIDNLPHQQGMFCVHFFGTNEYYWVPRGKTFLYQEGDKGSKSQSTLTVAKKFDLAMEEALVAFRKVTAERAEKDAARLHKGSKSSHKPPPYVRIDTNKPVGNVRLNKLDISSVNKCDCDKESENPCGSDDKCINRMLLLECVREVCLAGDKCGNQRFTKRQYPKVVPFKTEYRGWGLMTVEDIKKGDFVIEYVGELVDEMEMKRRVEEMHTKKEENYYFLTIDKNLIIDAGPKGNLSRFMNHSCQPNCITQKWLVGGNTRVGLFAMYDIPANSEVTFNYNLECIGPYKKKCECGAGSCSGYIGAKIEKEKKGMNTRKKKCKKRKEPKETDDECFRCGENGSLILCDMNACPKGYHLKCLGLNKPPRGKWICPWHHCDECGTRAKHKCELCPNSFCNQHVTGNLETLPNVGKVCQEHGEGESDSVSCSVLTVEGDSLIEASL